MIFVIGVAGTFLAFANACRQVQDSESGSSEEEEHLKKFCPQLLANAAVIKYDYKSGGNYGPDKWGQYSPTCDSKVRQSPIKLLTDCSIDYRHLPNLTFTDYDKAHDFTLKNTGHTVELEPPLSAKLKLRDGGLSSSGYKLLQLHFHWAHKDSEGSEHQINNAGAATVLELHFVHIRSDLTDVSAALGTADGLAVVAVLFHLDYNARSTPLEPLLTALGSVKNVNDSFKLNAPFKLSSLLPSNPQLFWRYNGSLTTPPCSEAVVWTALRTTQPVTPTQMSAFRAILLSRMDGGFDATNARRLQPLGSRTLIYKFPFRFLHLRFQLTTSSTLPAQNPKTGVPSKWTCHDP